jgi:predicted transcriptional regulator
LADQNDTGLLAMTAHIVASYLENNAAKPEDIPALITSVHASIAGLGSEPEPEEPEAPARLTPAAIRKLIQPDGITSLIDGRKFKSMRRHLSLQGFTPESYREHFGLPKDFPMVAPEYAAARSQLAKSMGLGARGRKPRAAEAPAKPARKARAAKTGQ